MRTVLHFSRGILIFLILLGFLPTVYAGEEDDALNLMASYFEALKSGQVKKLAAMLTDPMLDSKRMLLEQNPAYPAYLKKYYKDATMRVIDISRTETDRQTVTAEIFFPNDDRPLKSRFILKHTAAGWKIADESTAQ